MTLILSQRSDKNTIVISDTWVFSNSIWETREKVLYNKNLVICISWSIMHWHLMFEYIIREKLFWFKSYYDCAEIYSRFRSDMKAKELWDDDVSFSFILINKHAQFKIASNWVIDNELVSCVGQYHTEDYISNPLQSEEFVLHYAKKNIHVKHPIKKYVFENNKLYNPKIIVLEE